MRATRLSASSQKLGAAPLFRPFCARRRTVRQHPAAPVIALDPAPQRLYEQQQDEGQNRCAQHNTDVLPGRYVSKRLPKPLPVAVLARRRRHDPAFGEHCAVRIGVDDRTHPLPFIEGRRQLRKRKRSGHAAAGKLAVYEHGQIVLRLQADAVAAPETVDLQFSERISLAVQGLDTVPFRRRFEQVRGVEIAVGNARAVGVLPAEHDADERRPVPDLSGTGEAIARIAGKAGLCACNTGRIGLRRIVGHAVG